MKKKLFSLMMTLVLAFMGVAQAEVVTIGSGTETSTRLPGYTYYKYASSQQLYTPAEIGSAGTINSIAFFNDGESRTRTIDLYLVNTSKTAFNSSIDWIQPTTADQVFTGSVTFTPGTWTTITLTTPFDYDGTSNLAVIYVDHTGSYLSGTQMACRVYQGAENSAMWKYQDSVYDPFTAVASGMNSSSASAEAKIKNQIQLDMTPTGGGGGATYDDKLHVKYEDPVNGEIIDSLNLGVRPIGAWMAPFEFVMYSEGPVYQVNVLDFTPTDGLFSIVDQEMPYEVAPGADVDLLMSTNGTAAGVVERQFVAITELVREAHIWPVVVEFYSPEVPDVWEKACPDVPANVPYATAFIEKPELVHGTTLHNDYTLPFPEVPEGYDAVYKLQYNKDVILNARVSSGADGKVALYAQDFNGEGGPMADNYYYGPVLPSQGRVNRANMTFDFEDGSLPAGWTCEGDDVWTVGTGDYSTSTGAHGGTYNAKCTHSTTGNETYLVTNPMNFSGVTSGTINCYFVNRSWVGDTDEFGVYYRTNGGAWHELYYTTAPHASWTEMGEIALAGFGPNYQIGFLYVDNWGYGVGLDDITITTNAGGGGGGGGGEFIPGEGGGMATITYGYGPEISDMPVEKGTYYLVASSTESDFEVTIDAAPMPCPSVEENEVFSFNPSPADNADSIQPASVNLSWTIPTYATQWRIIVGSTYHPELNHPQTIYYPHDANGGWGWSTELASSFTIPEPLWNNTNYFWRVEFRNDGACTDGVSSPVWGFTTTLNIPQNLQVSDENIFDDETVTLTWDQVVDRTYRKYFIYRNFAEPSNSADVFERIGETEIHHIDSTRFVDGPLPYNMEPGYTYYVTAVYDEGESYFSNPAFVKVSGYGMVSGHVYEIDGTTGIPGATVTLEGEDEFGDSHTYNFVTDENGFYQDSLYVGVYDAVATCPGYQPVAEPLCGNPVTIIYDNTTTPVDFIMDENFYGPCGVRAEYYPDVTDPNSEYVKVYWGCGLPVAPIIEDFETGNFNAYGWVNGTTNPWTIETTNVHAGAYSMKSGGAGVNSSESVISVEIEVPEDGLVSFYGKISSESGYDYGNFYLDNTRKTHISGNIDWTLYEYPVTAGTHTFKWTYTKDVSQAAGDDCFYVDDITFFRQPSSEDTRALNHYRVYRTNCYQDSPYTEENTVLLATVWVPDTVYIDVEWADLEPGVYKWGVGAVYVGIRSGEEIESPITWTEPIAVNNTEVTANRDVILHEGFESGDLNGWTMVDCNEYSGVSDVYSYDGDYAFRFHWTYDEPDYLISPVLNASGSMNVSFWYRTTSSYWEETFQVGYSSTTNDPSAFTWGPEYMASADWEQYTGTAPAGTKYMSVMYTAHDQFYLYIDEIDITGAAGGGGGSGSGSMDNPYAAGTEPIQLERESILMWSNCLDKDMYLSQVDVNVELNSADNAFGTTVTLTNLNEIEQGQYAIDPVVLDSSEFYAWETFRRGRYAIEVEKDGYYTIYDTVRIWDEPTHLRYVMTEILYGVGDIYVSRTGWASWGDYVAPEPTPGPGPEPGPGGEAWTCDFESADLDADGWTVVRAGGGNEYTDWRIYDGNFSGHYVAPHSGNYVVMGRSWSSSAYNVDNWLITPQVALNGALSYWVQDDGQYHEHYDVYVSTTTPDVSAFTLLYEPGNASDAWVEHTVDLSSYAGQQGYIAFRLTDEDQDWLFIDDVTIGTPATRANDRHLEYYKVMCTSIDGEPIFNHNTPANQPFCQLTTVDPNNGNAVLLEGEHYLVKVACMYSSGMSAWSDPVEWVYEPCEHWGPVDEVVAETQTQGNHLAWVFDHSYNPYSLEFDRNRSNDNSNVNSFVQYANAPVYRQYAEDGVTLNFMAIRNYDLRAYMLYNLSKDNRFSLMAEDEYGQFVVTPAFEMHNFMEEFESFYENVYTNFSLLSKNDIAEQLATWKSGVSAQYFTSITMDYILNSTRVENDHCINSLPFCTTEQIQFAAATTSQTASEQGMDDGCISYSYNPSWYHMRIRTAGQFIIHMEAIPDNAGDHMDVDFVVWGPYTEEEVTSGYACTHLTTDKIIDCSYSSSGTEDAYLGYPLAEHDHPSGSVDGNINYHVPQVGEYYIIMLTNYSQNPCTISFTKTEGEGETDCELVAPSDALGFLITMDGEFLTFIMDPNAREYDHVGEFGEHEYCVRPIYPGLQELPEHNYYFSMGCPVAANWGPIDQTCEAGEAIHAEAMGATDQVKIWWGEQTPPPGPGEPFYDDFESGAITDWTVIRAGQGTEYTDWHVVQPMNLFQDQQIPAHSGDYCVMGRSWNSTAYNVDNWLITPQIDLGGMLSYWVMDDGQYHEHYDVYVSNTTNDVAAFELLYTPGNASADWTEHTVDLTSFNGQRGYIAFRLTDNDQDFLFIDDVAVDPTATRNRDAQIVKYNVYRSADPEAEYTLIGEVPAVEGQTYYEYIDTPEATGMYFYQVTAVYDNECESDPAISGDNPALNYVQAEVTGLGENNDKVALYPNPTKGNVTIEANGMSRITVVSVLGQVVFDTELDADSYILNMAQFNAGMYMVRVYTEEGVTVKRVTVMQ